MSGVLVRVGVLALLLLLAGCSKVTQENYAKIQVGMRYADVVAILGEPARCDSVLSATYCMWGSAKRSIDVSFVADKVVFLKSSGL